MRSASSFAALFLLTVLVGPSPCAAQTEQVPAERSAPAPPSVPTFAGELEVNLINVFVTVLDDNGRPITGFTRDNFAVYEHDQPMEITNFSEIRRDSPNRESVRARTAETLDDRLTGAIEVDGESGHVALVFDNLSLEKRNRKRVLKSIGDFVLACTERHDRLSVATTGEDFRILEPFTNDGRAIVQTLGSLNKTPAQGDDQGSRTRMLRREILNAELLPDDANRYYASGDDYSIDREMVMIRSAKFLTQIDTYRLQEQVRLRNTLRGIHEMVRSMAALPGRKHLVWFGEGLVMHPGLDLYQAFYTKFARWADEINLDRPEIWAEGYELANEFASVAATAQVAGATLHLVDATNRDRDVADSAFASVANNAFFATEDGGTRIGAEYNIAHLQKLQDGARYLAQATGGTFIANTRDFDRYFEDLEAILGSYYSIGYRRPQDPNAALRPVRIDLAHDPARVHHQGQVVSKTPTQRLADGTLSRLRFGTGDNPFEMSVALDGTEPVDERRYIQTIRLGFPTGLLSFAGDDQNHTDQLLVVFQTLDGDGFTRPPQLMPLTISIPSDRLSPGALAQARVRLVVGMDTERLGVGVLEQSSGLQATTAVEVAPASVATASVATASVLE